MGTLDQIISAAKAAKPRIILAEGEDPRIVEAALRAAREGIAQMMVVADQGAFDALAADAPGADLVEVHDPKPSPLLDGYAEAFYELRKHKGLSPEAAREAMLGNLSFAAMMVRQGDADGTIAGAVATTADVCRAALQIIGKAPDADVVSSFFLMLLGEPFSRPVVFADCGLIMQPTDTELASIAAASAASMQAMTGETPRVAMLSFSTMGSVPPKAHESISRIRSAVAMLNARHPDLIVDGEIQFDAAIVPDIADKKAPGSSLDGHANVFVFPSLSAGNIGYKIAERIGGAVALGPVLQGLRRPANDLSRGCSAEDVYRMIAITGVQAAQQSGSSNEHA